MNTSNVATWGGLWPVLALINAGLAQSKGRSGAIWFFISLLAGPLATLAIVVLPRVELDGAMDARRADARLGLIVAVIVALVIALWFLAVVPVRP